MAKKEPVASPDDIELNVNVLLSHIRESDSKQVEAQMDIARLLACIKEYKLYLPKYDSFKQLVINELDFAFSTALNYVSLYQCYTRLGYGREQMLKLMRQLGWRKVQFCLRTSKKRMSLATMNQYLEDHYYARDKQFNFNMRSETTARKLEKLLVPFGLTINADGRRAHMAESLEAMMADYERLQRQGEQMDMLEEAESEDTPARSTRTAKRAAEKAAPAKAKRKYTKRAEAA